MKKYGAILLITAALVFFAAGMITGIVTRPGVYAPYFRVVGDNSSILTVKSTGNQFKSYMIMHNGKKYNAIKLQDIYKASKPVNSANDLLLSGDDGLMAQIHDKDLEKCYIAFTKANGWEAVNPDLPVSSNIKRIKEIVIVSTGVSDEYGLSVITPQKNVLYITPGQMYLKALEACPLFEGKSQVEKDGDIRETTIYTVRKLLKLGDLVKGPDFKKILAMGTGGDNMYDSGKGFLELKDNSINYILPDKKKKIENLAGIILDPPLRSIKDACQDTLYYTHGGRKVLLLYLDGFGYHQYSYAVANGYAPYIKTLPAAEMASSVYKPVTNAGMAAMITGKSPMENGVHSRSERELKVPSIFDALTKLGKKSLLIEGNIGILKTEVQPILNLDSDGSGTTDEEVFASAMSNMKNNPDFMLVHLHGIDDIGHEKGELSLETMQYIKKADQYVRQLISIWDGAVIITSDHGMHDSGEGGTHGVFRYEDLVVPYITVD